jgi:hypothetical protein
MSIRSFWNIVLKLVGIWIVVSSLPLLPNFLFSMGYGAYGMYDPNYFQIFSFGILFVGLMLLIIRLFVFRTTWLIDRLKLEDGFEEKRIEVDLRYNTILSIAIVIVGGMWFVQNLTDFVRELVSYFQNRAMVNESSSTPWLIYYAMSTVLGYVVLTNSQPIVKFILKQIEDDGER